MRRRSETVFHLRFNGRWGALEKPPLWQNDRDAHRLDLQVDALDVEAVADRWRATTELLYDLDGDGVISVADVMRVAAGWDQGRP